MKHPSNSVLPAPMAKVCRHFEQWRSQQETRRRLPDHLWSLAVELAREYGVSKTARILNLDYNRLKARSKHPVFKECVDETPTVEFMELLSDRTHSPVECTVECEQGQGTKIRIQLKGPDWPDLTGLCARLWSTDR